VLAAADTVDGFVAFTRGELASPTNPAAALRWFDRSRQLSARSTQTYVGHLAAVGRTAVLIRLGRQADAIAACAEQIVSLRRVGMTAQVWTMLRLTAELLGSLGDVDTAVAILDAADADPLAPAVMGPDRERQARLRASRHTPPHGYGDAVDTSALALGALDRYRSAPSK
jgi:hypothetical protein